MSDHTLSQPIAGSQFDNVDASDDPQARVRYLDSVTAITRYKQESLMFLDLHPGDHVLDVGCGTGDDVRAMAEIVGQNGHVVGIDLSETMIAEARRRSNGSDASVEFQVCDAHNLPFADDTFDVTMADRVLQHIPDRDIVLREMIRVTKPSGRVVAGDPDWETLVLDVPDRALFRTLLARYVDRRSGGWTGRQHYRLFHDAGLSDLSILTATIALTDFGLADALFELSSMAEEGLKVGVVTQEQANAWTRDLNALVEAGHFFTALTGFGIKGRKGV